MATGRRFNDFYSLGRVLGDGMYEGSDLDEWIDWMIRKLFCCS